MIINKFPIFGRKYSHHLFANYDPLISSPQIEEFIRHPKIITIIQILMGEKFCINQIGLRIMYLYGGEYHHDWHRDRSH